MSAGAARHLCASVSSVVGGVALDWRTRAPRRRHVPRRRYQSTASKATATSLTPGERGARGAGGLACGGPVAERRFGTRHFGRAHARACSPQQGHARASHAGTARCAAPARQPLSHRHAACSQAMHPSPCCGPQARRTRRGRPRACRAPRAARWAPRPAACPAEAPPTRPRSERAAR